MTNTKNTHGGKREGAGRPAAGTKNVGIQITPEEHAKLQALGGSAWIRARLAEVTLNRYRFENAYSVDGPIENVIRDCYEDAFEFEAENDAAAVAKVEALQDRHDKAARAVIAQAERDESPDVYKLEESFSNAPCYTYRLERYDAAEDEWIRVEC